MTVRAKHSKVSTASEGSDSSKVRTSDWNADHAIHMNGAGLVGRSASGDGTASEIALGDRLAFDGSSIKSDTPSGFDIVLLAGQSNMEGQTTLDANIDTANSSVFQFASTPSSGYYRKIISGADPLHHIRAINTGKVGLGTWFAKAYTRITGRDVLLIPYGFSSTALVSSPANWSPSGGTLYTGAIAQANLAIIEAQKLYPDSHFVGTLWFQGESDGAGGVSQSSYASALTSLIAGFRSSITEATNSWFIMAQMVPEAIATRSGYSTIDLAHKQVRDNVAKTALVLTNDLTGNSSDNLHFNTGNAIRILGARMAEAIPAANANTGVAAAPSQVTGLAVSSIGATSVALSWNVPTAGGVAVDYIVEYKETSSGTWLLFNDGSSASPTATVTGLSNSTAYDFRVSATNATGTGTVSSTVSATTTAALSAPNSPTGLTVGTITSSSVALSWTAPSGGGAVSNYVIEYKETSSGTWLTFSTTVTTTSSVVTGLTASTAYDFRVSSQNATATSAPTATSSATTSSGGAAPGQVTGLTVTATTGSTVSLAWTAPGTGGTPTDYIVEFKLTADSTWTTFTDGVSTGLTAEVTGLITSASYDFRVSATNATGTGTVSSTVSATTYSSTVIYTFEGDTVGAAPVNITKRSTAFTPTMVVRNTGVTGLTGKYVNWSATDTGSAKVFIGSLDLAPSSNQQIVTWKRGQSSINTCEGMILRTHGTRGTNNSASSWSGAPLGYLFSVHGNTTTSNDNVLKIWRMTSSALVQIGTFNQTPSTIGYYRASALGDNLKFETSTDGVTWTARITITDTVYTGISGGVDWISGVGGNQADCYVDDIVINTV